MFEPFDDPHFSAEGHLIAQEIKRELPDWTVIYRDEAAYWAREKKKPKIWDRSFYEYEIGLTDEQLAPKDF